MLAQEHRTRDCPLLICFCSDVHVMLSSSSLPLRSHFDFLYILLSLYFVLFKPCRIQLRVIPCTLAHSL